METRTVKENESIDLLTKKEIYSFVKNYMQAESFCAHEIKAIIISFINLIVNNPHLYELCQSLSTLTILCSAWKANFLENKDLIKKCAKDNFGVEALLFEFIKLVSEARFLSTKKIPKDSSDLTQLYNECALNFGFLEYSSFISMSNQKGMVLKNEDILKFSFIENYDRDKLEYQFIHPLFKSYFCARYLISCLLAEKKIHHPQVYPLYFHMPMNAKLGCGNINRWVSKIMDDDVYVRMFVKQLLKQYEHEKLLDHLPITLRNQFLDSLFKKNYEWLLHRDDNELTITYIKSDEGYKYFVPKYCEIEKMIGDWLEENKLHDITFTTSDNEPYIFQFSSDDKANLDKVFSWFEKIAASYSRQPRHSNLQLNSLFSTLGKSQRVNSGQASDVRIECRLF